MKILLLLAFFTGFFYLGFSQNAFTLSGFVEDSTTGERLPAADIIINDKAVAQSNSFGFFTLTQKSTEEIVVKVTYSGYLSFQKKINGSNTKNLIIKLIPDEDFIGEITILSREQPSIISNEIGKISMPVDAIKKMPRILGENDVLKSLQTLPGITQGIEASSGILVRGGSPDQNLFLLDGATVYNPTHLGGVFSPFNADAIKTVDVYKGGFPARYGQRLSSVTDMVIKDGNMKKLDGEGSVGMIAAKALVEGPIKKDKTSFLVSARRSYLDLLAKALIKITNTNEEKRNLGFYFYDVYGKINHIVSDKDRVYASFFVSKDNYRLRTRSNYDQFKSKEDHTVQMKWSNITSAVRWNHIFNAKLFSNTTLNFTNYRFATLLDTKDNEDNVFSETYAKYYSNIRDLSIKTDLEYHPTSNHALRFGGWFTQHAFLPGTSSRKYNSSVGEADQATSGFEEQQSPEISLYAEDRWKITNRLEANIGAHGNVFRAGRKWYTSIQPRLSVNYNLPANYGLKASYLHMNQNIHLLAYNAIALPTDLWVPSTDKIKPMFSRQVSAGITKKLPQAEIDISVEGYYKTMNGVIEYKDGASPFNSSVERWDDMVEQGTGKAYGVEFLLQKKFGRATSWISYAWSKSDRQFETINNSQPFYFKYDRRHVANLVYMYKLSERWDFSAVWQYQSGAPQTIPTAKYEAATDPFENSYGKVEYINGRNEFRLLDYHRLDLSFTWHKKKRNYEKLWNFSLYNVYNRKNPMTYSVESNTMMSSTEPEDKVLQGKVFLPFFPSISYSIKF